MVIEWLEFDVDPRKRNAFIERDQQVWTQGLKQFKGFLGKEVWIDSFFFLCCLTSQYIYLSHARY